MTSTDPSGLTMQSLPFYPLGAGKPTSRLVTRFNSTLVNTVPLWETQVGAGGSTIQRKRRSRRCRAPIANDLTKNLLTFERAERCAKATRSFPHRDGTAAFSTSKRFNRPTRPDSDHSEIPANRRDEGKRAAPLPQKGPTKWKPICATRWPSCQSGQPATLFVLIPFTLCGARDMHGNG